MRILLASLFALLLAAAPAQAWEWKVADGGVAGGPQLTGDGGTAWVEGHAQIPMSVKVGPAGGGAPRTLYTLDPTGGCDAIGDVAASPQVVAIRRHPGTPGEPCGNVRYEIVANGASGRQVLVANADWSTCGLGGWTSRARSSASPAAAARTGP